MKVYANSEHPHNGFTNQLPTLRPELARTDIVQRKEKIIKTEDTKTFGTWIKS